jgi:hypothetical protein
MKPKRSDITKSDCPGRGCCYRFGTMKTTSLFLSPFCALAAALLYSPSTVSATDEPKDKTPWKITGQLEEACSCDAACPCWFDSKPTKMTCSGGQVLFIQRGNYGKVKLDGLAIAEMSQSPEGEAMMASFGNWNFSYNYIDEKATPEQRKALEALAAKLLVPGASKKTETRYVPINRKIEGKDHEIHPRAVRQFSWSFDRRWSRWFTENCESAGCRSSASRICTGTDFEDDIQRCRPELVVGKLELHVRDFHGR